MKLDFNAPIGDKETGPSTREEVEGWVVNYRAAIMERYEGLPVNDEGYFNPGVEGTYDSRVVVYPLLFGFLPKWRDRREVSTPSDVERIKNDLPWYYTIKIVHYTFIPHR